MDKVESGSPSCDGPSERERLTEDEEVSESMELLRCLFLLGWDETGEGGEEGVEFIEGF
jgi:hypothetical protein